MGEIRDFYADRTVLVTGGTGFLGKMMVEKLLRSCDPKRIFLLFRSKRGETPTQRLEKYFDSPMFANLTEVKSDFKRKIEVLEGDAQRPNLGLKVGDVQRVMREVEVIFHWAATLNFMENLKVATEINVKSVRDLLIMAGKMPQLKSFLYVSTAFSHCLQKEIHETLYDDTLDGNSLITLMDSLNEKTADDITAGYYIKLIVAGKRNQTYLSNIVRSIGLLGEWPNTYVYTKSAAENIIKTDGLGLPVGIFRPSIVTAAYKEPLPGWVDNLFGYTGFLLSIFLGYIRVTDSDPKLRVNFVPADYVVNATLAAAWQISKRGGNEISIYNFADRNEHCLTVGKLTHLSHVSASKVPTPKAMWYDYRIYARNELSFKILNYLLHYIPAQTTDVIALISRRRPRYVNLYYKVKKTADVLRYFTTREWSFNNDNVVALWNSMCQKDREVFEFDMSALDWSDYMDQYVLGIRLYILKDPLDTIPAGKKRLLQLKIIHYVTLAFPLFVLYYFMSWILP